MEYLMNLGSVGERDAAGVVTIKPNLWLLTPDDMPPILFTPEDVARTLHIGRPKVYDLMRTGALRSIKVGGSRRISAKSLAAYVESLDAAASA
jgi:excisionase family DNA binding protein